METVFIDGSFGEGGGQILRTSLALACITGKHLHMENIRAARPKPGLARQHLAAVHAAARICSAECTGVFLGSKTIDFIPGPVRPGSFNFEIGSSGSVSLVAQTILPALFLADKPSMITITGGTHNPLAPPYDFIRDTFLPAIASAGFHADCRLDRFGFYPAGGGREVFTIQPWQKSPASIIEFCKPFNPGRLIARIYTAHLPARIAEKQKHLLLACPLSFHAIEHIEVDNSLGSGNCVTLSLLNDHIITFTAFGMRGKPSEHVINEVVTQVSDFLKTSASIDHFLADQLVIYMALLGYGCFTTNIISAHLLTNIETIKKFLPVTFAIEHQPLFHKVTCHNEIRGSL